MFAPSSGYLLSFKDGYEYCPTILGNNETVVGFVGITTPYSVSGILLDAHPAIQLVHLKFDFNIQESFTYTVPNGKVLVGLRSGRVNLEIDGIQETTSTHSLTNKRLFSQGSVIVFRKDLANVMKSSFSGYLISPEDLKKLR